MRSHTESATPTSKTSCGQKLQFKFWGLRPPAQLLGHATFHNPSDLLPTFFGSLMFFFKTSPKIAVHVTRCRGGGGGGGGGGDGGVTMTMMRVMMMMMTMMTMMMMPARIETRHAESPDQSSSHG